MPLRKLYLELTSSCNLNCTICYRRAWPEASHDMDAPILRAVAAYAAGARELKTIVLGGIGEPTGAPLFSEAIASFPGKDILVTTNGVDLGSGILDGLAAYAAQVVFSVDGLDAAFRRIRGTGLDSVMASVRNLASRRRVLGKETPRMEFLFVLSEDNAEDLQAVVDLAVENGIGRIAVSHLLPQEADGAAAILYGRTAGPAALRLFERVRLRAMRHGVSILLPPLELKTERRCAFAEEDAAFINAEGELVPCYRFSHDGTEFVFGRKKRVLKHSFGRLDGGASLDELWNAASYGEFRRSLLHNRYPSCPDCDLLEGCSLTEDTTADCWSSSPSCADCLWARGFMRCP